MPPRKVLTIPPSLAQYTDKIRGTVRTAINLNLKPSENLLPWQSKIGGIPYLPSSAEYPRQSITGEPLKLLAQINFAETPRLTGYPEKGILQFYLDPTDLLHGLGEDFEYTGQKQYRVLYFEDVEEDISKLKTNDIFRIEDDNIINLENGKKMDFYWPISPDGQLSIEFEFFQQYMTSDDYRTRSEIFGCDPNQSWVEQYDSLKELFNEYEEHFRGYGHQIGGYPYHIQGDPKETHIELREFELLFQLDTEFFKSDNVEMCWGEVGVVNFLIRPQDLEKRDFSNVIVYWDCF